MYCCSDGAKLIGVFREAAQAAGWLVNCADDPENSDFQSPAIIKHEGYTISISSAGKNPGETKAMRKKLEELLEKDHLN